MLVASLPTGTRRRPLARDCRQARVLRAGAPWRLWFPAHTSLTLSLSHLTNRARWWGPRGRKNCCGGLTECTAQGTPTRHMEAARAAPRATRERSLKKRVPWGVVCSPTSHIKLVVQPACEHTWVA